ncbi:unnamed protein product (macronuclear) [Paramecium tetraurelia]|uniref:Chromosome undetermined scaffold_1, whole genome shotgun sequence n=1 Tax=Paramecium tetraurelia TaxID=5888 RepID=Q6BFU6_PARTE|nr:hypothetical protein [Paramecium tetraurelia strain d4-2]XP_001423194.1 uncharacterized protein GSPATT00000231001 [Paramecium tetraurelia]CAH03474.1 hypothetical protein PTMB.276 [Paramecium tetraurelia]CAK55796.1 unnamed protein product [Paramecium tetraurelia]|eukprot:XP_001423194.1 hypothetical protein (macronuclear) [Paramecium tetraurelia strain d4-2]
MYIIIASAIILAISFTLQLTKVNPKKKLYILDIFLILLGAMAIYSETTHKLGDFTEQLQAAFSKQYPIEYQLDELILKNQIQLHSYQLFYGMKQDGISTLFKFIVNQQIKDSKQAIYINIQSEIQTQEQALQLFGTNNLHELIHFTQQRPTTIVIDNLHLSLSKKQCYICPILSNLHKFNTTTILISAKELHNLNYLLDDYSVNVMEIREFDNGKQLHFRYDWSQQSIQYGKKYEDMVLQKQKEFVIGLTETEKQIMGDIRKLICKIKCENQKVKIDDLIYQHSDLKQIVEKNYVIAQFGYVKFYNSFIFESLQYL